MFIAARFDDATGVLQFAVFPEQNKGWTAFFASEIRSSAGLHGFEALGS
jgi:hypothetical protein